jgi:tRNA C32,U32 (ribose-2'-O)-methylase TrmJ
MGIIYFSNGLIFLSIPRNIATSSLCQILMTIPGNPDYFSLNVASAIQVFAYQNYVYNTTTQFKQSSNEIAVCALKAP